VGRDSLGEACDGGNIQGATDGLLVKLLQDASGWKEFKKGLTLCNDLNGDVDTDVYNLVSTLAGNFEGVLGNITEIIGLLEGKGTFECDLNDIIYRLFIASGMVLQVIHHYRFVICEEDQTVNGNRNPKITQPSTP